MGDRMATAAELLRPIVTLMIVKILQSRVVQNDDSPAKVQDRDGQGIKAGRLRDSTEIRRRDRRFQATGESPSSLEIQILRPDHPGDPVADRTGDQGKTHGP
jgi:hypothetical protein